MSKPGITNASENSYLAGLDTAHKAGMSGPEKYRDRVSGTRGRAELIGLALMFVVGSAAVTGCSAAGGDPAGGDPAAGSSAAEQEQPAAASQGELLAHVELSATHRVEFRALGGGKAGLGILEYGTQGELPLDRADWETIGAEKVYRRLANREAPAALVQAAELARTRQLQVGPVRTIEDVLPAPKLRARSNGQIDAARTATEGQGEPIKILRSFAVDPNAGLVPTENRTSPIWDDHQAGSDGVAKVTQNVYGDSSWFSQNFCAPTADIESNTIWCMTNRGSVQGGTRYTMYYSAAGMSAPGGQGANFYVEWYDWNAGVWRTQYSSPLAAGGWVTYTWNGEVTFRSSIYGVNNSAVHFVDKSRRQITYLSNYTDYPSDIGWDFGNDIQGVTHDPFGWMMSRTDYGLDSSPDYGELTSIGVERDLKNEPSFVVPEPSAWRGSFPHYGALAYRSGYLYVPIDGPGGCAIGVFKSNDLSAVGYKLVDSTTHCGWLAYNPKDKLFYGPLENKPSEQIFKYDIQVTSAGVISLTKKGSLTLSTPVSRISGADFSKRGVLWLFAGYAALPLNLYAVDTQNGFVYHRVSFTRGGGPAADFEAEGVTLWDLTYANAPGIKGHVHLQILRNDVWSDDNWWFNHLVASDPTTL